MGIPFTHNNEDKLGGLFKIMAIYFNHRSYDTGSITMDRSREREENAEV